MKNSTPALIGVYDYFIRSSLTAQHLNWLPKLRCRIDVSALNREWQNHKVKCWWCSAEAVGCTQANSSAASSSRVAKDEQAASWTLLSLSKIRRRRPTSRPEFWLVSRVHIFIWIWDCAIRKSSILRDRFSPMLSLFNIEQCIEISLRHWHANHVPSHEQYYNSDDIINKSRSNLQKEKSSCT